MFSSINYKYDPAGSGYLLTWQVKEEPAPLLVRLHIPGIDGQHYGNKLVALAA